MQTRSQTKQLILQTAMYFKDKMFYKNENIQDENPTNNILFDYVPPKYSIVHDFDDASSSWKLNKISSGNGTYTYKCAGFTKCGEACSQKIFGATDFCKRHQKQNKSL